MKDRIVFLIHTEYHLLVTASIVSDKFPRDKFEIVIIQNASSRRFNLEIDTRVLADEYIIIDENGNLKNKTQSSLSQIISRVVATPTKYFIGFLEQSPLFVLFSRKCKRNKIITVLAPDGSKPYARITKMALPSRIRKTIDNNKFFKHAKLNFRSLRLISWDYARNKDIMEVWVTAEQWYENRTKKTVLPISILEGEQSILLANSLFQFDIYKKPIPSARVLFYMNQPFVDSSLSQGEQDILKNILDNVTGHQLVIKLHPLTTRKQIEFYRTLNDLVIIEDTYPSELYMANLSDSIFISFWSSSLFSYYKTNRYYWLYKLLEQNGNMLHWLKIFNPTDHIKVVNSLNEVI